MAIPPGKGPQITPAQKELKQAKVVNDIKKIIAGVAQIICPAGTAVAEAHGTNEEVTINRMKNDAKLSEYEKVATARELSKKSAAADLKNVTKQSQEMNLEIQNIIVNNQRKRENKDKDSIVLAEKTTDQENSSTGKNRDKKDKENLKAKTKERKQDKDTTVNQKHKAKTYTSLKPPSYKKPKS